MIAAENHKTLAFSVAVSVLIPLVMSLLLLWSAPRPFYLFDDDIEADYYWNSQRIHAGLPVLGLYHPGTPIYYLGAGLLKISGPALDDVQRFLLLGRGLQMFFSALSLIAFSVIAMRRVPLATAALALTLIVAWPSFLSYYDYFGSTFFVAAVGLPTLALFWSSLEFPTERPLLKQTLSGIGIGLCLAIKMSFLPVAIAVFLSLFISESISLGVDWRDRKFPGALAVYQPLVLMALAAVVAFVISTFPVLNRLYLILLIAFSRGDIAPDFAEIVPLLRGVLAFSPLYTLLVIVTFLVLLFSAIRMLARLIAHKHSELRSRESLSSLAAFFFCATGLAQFIYAFGLSAREGLGHSVGLTIRNVWPTALMLPFLVLFVNLSRRRGAIRTYGPAWTVAAVAFSVATIGFAVRENFHERRATLAYEQQLSDGVQSILQRLYLQSGKRVAIDPASMSVGDAGFLLWGNNSYGGGVLDEELLRRYPHIVTFRLREVLLLAPAVDAESLSESRGVRRKLRELRRQYFPDLTHDPVQPKRPDLIPFESTDPSIGAIVFPSWEWEKRPKPLQTYLTDQIVQQWGMPTVSREIVAGVEWVVLDRFQKPGLPEAKGDSSYAQPVRSGMLPVR